MTVDEDEPVETSAEQGWADEIASRADRVAAGDFSATDWRESVERIQSVLASRRSSF